MGPETPFSKLLRDIAEFIDSGVKAPAQAGATLCAIAGEYVNNVSRVDAVATFRAASAAIDVVSETYNERRYNDGVSIPDVSDVGGPIPAVKPRTRKGR